jgi:hypothetical protein
VGRELAAAWWQDSRMFTLLADPAATCSTPWWNTFAGPVGVVFGALITGGVTWRNARKSIYERLETLVNVRKVWPTELAGGATVDHSIAIALAEIRRKQPGHAPEPATQREREADREVKTTWRRQNRWATIGALTAAIVGFAVPLLSHSAANQSSGGSVDFWLPVVLTAGATLIAGLVTFLVARR